MSVTTFPLRASPGRRKFRHRGVVAFSLVEVTLAIGVFSFCLISLVGLMPVGLTAVKSAHEEAAAVNCLSYLATSIRKAGADVSGTNYVALGCFSNSLSWSLGGSDFATTLSPLSMGGTPAATGFDQRLVARVEIHPPAGPATPGSARISVAWPQSATWTTNWQNAQGSVSTWLVFLPRP